MAGGMSGRGGGTYMAKGSVHAGETVTEAGGTHPTGMHSSCNKSLKIVVSERMFITACNVHMVLQ